MVDFLRKRGLAVSDGNYSPFTDFELRKAHPKLTQAPAAGFTINYRNVKGEATGFFRFRYLEQPQQSGWDKLVGRALEERRYLQPAGAPRAYFPKKVNWHDFFSRAAKDRCLTITEGELKAECAIKAGVPTIGLGGVWNFKVAESPELIPDLAKLPWRDMKVQICFDSDAVSNQHVLDAENALAELLERKGAIVHIKRLPPLEHGLKAGLDDYLVAKAGSRLATKGRAAYERVPVTAWYSPDVPNLVVQRRSEFLKHAYSEREEILVSKAGVFMRHPTITQIHAYRGVGKTNVAFCLANALATAGKFFRWHGVRPMRVLYVEGEQPAADLQQQVSLLTVATDNLLIMHLEGQQDWRFPKIVSDEGRKAFERAIRDFRAEVIVLDSLSTLANIAMNDEENQLALGDWFIRLRTGLKVSVIYLQHDGKSGQQRGHSKHEDWIDLSIHLIWPTDYTGAEGLRCRFHIDKARRPIRDGQDMRVSLRPDLRNPRRTEWAHVATTAKEEKEQKKFDRAYQLLWMEDGLGNEVLIKRLRDEGVRGNNTELRGICDRARQVVLEQRGKIGPPKFAAPAHDCRMGVEGRSARGRQKQ
jgi:hypothetical protein